MSQANREEDNLPERPAATEGSPQGNPGPQDQDNPNDGASHRAADAIPQDDRRDDLLDDPRDDPMAPPAEPCECFCLHCGRTFMSDRIWFQKVKGARDGFPGFWMCPTPNCDGAGFTFDIFPTDPNHPANDGWHYDDGDDDEGEDGEWEDEQGNDELAGDEENNDGTLEDESDRADTPEDWDPEESKYKAMDEWEEDDLEGEEWKLGLQPGERPKAQAPPPGVEPRNQAEQEALYDQPDRRPRELDWSDRDDRPYRGNPGSSNADNDSKPGQAGEWFDDDDIPF